MAIEISHVELEVPAATGGSNVDALAASAALNGTQPVRTSSVRLLPPSTLDIGAPPSAPPPAGGSNSDWLTVALTDMRKDPTTGTYSYTNSYATNEAKPYLRTRLSYSSQYDRAQLTMGRYPNPTAFTTTNPDYNNELSYVDPDDPARSWGSWNGLMWWAGIWLAEPYAGTSTKHDSGYQNNTRVVIWDVQVWRKATGGTWHRHIKTDSPSGEAWYPDFRSGLTTSAPGYDKRSESTGYSSYRTTPPTGVASDGLYRCQHPYGGLTSWAPGDVSEIVSTCKMALVLHNSSGPDDRDASRFLAHVGADYYPEPAPNTGLAYYFGVGTSRCKYVRAKYPNFQYHVMHTASWNSLASSYPNVNS